MIEQTKALTLSSVRFQESSLIVHIYTERFGRRDYIIKGAFSKKSNKASFYQPLNLLELQVYEQPNKNLQMIKEVRVDYPLLSFRIQPKKSMILTFLTEFLEKVLKDDEIGNPELFQFLTESLLSLDAMNENFNCFTLQFMIRMSHFLGIGIHDGKMLLEETEVTAHVDPALVQVIDQLIEKDYHEAPSFNLHTRRIVMDKILSFYELQIQSFGKMKTLEVLRNVGNPFKKH
ncbi:DNA repair protein RecO [Flammeovirga aprica]|uniref:DNA repair protein RecO n=1 Tax=Flammeovirga aprica JL-4 TaxID=694437 RepID=A0A7X9P0U4_9BACT|nr:DNA repair protein RecO [Flammeovirga aprica]NME67153.1 DNA repair protein RecO [Flammeovirga aprica JL-4]